MVKYKFEKNYECVLIHERFPSIDSMYRLSKCKDKIQMYLIILKSFDQLHTTLNSI